MKLVILHGRPGVGKLTVGRELQTLTGYRLFHNHLAVDLVLSLLPFDAPSFASLRERIWLDALTTAAEAGLEGVIFTFVFEPTVPADFYPRLVEAMRLHGCSVHPFELTCDVAENARRVAQPDRRRYRKETSAESLTGGIEAGVYEAPVPVPGNVQIDTTSLLPEETARRVLAHLQA